MSGASREPLKDLIREIHRRSVWQVLGVYVVGGWIAFEVVQTLTEGLGLPEWFPPLALVLLIIGLPIVLATAFVQEGGPQDRFHDEIGELDEILRDEEESRAQPPGGAPRLFTWRNAILGGVAASVLWVGLATSWLIFGGGQLPTDLAGGVGTSEASATTEQSVAVLPFENMSADPDNEYFSDGITEEILNALTQVRGLRVPGRTSSFAFQGENVTIAEVADTLDVTHVVEGSVRKAGDRVRITAQLIDARDDQHLWSQTYERSLQDIFAVQVEIARSITEALEVRLAGRDSMQLASEGTAVPEAHDAYLRGRFSWNQRTGESLRRAAEQFRTAIEIDSAYAEAWSGLADTYSTIPWYPRPGDSDDRLNIASLRSRSLEAAQRAVALAPERAMTQTSLAEAYFFNGAWEEADRAFQRAIELSRGYVPAEYWYGQFLTFTGRPEDGIPHLRRAVELDPVSRMANYGLTNSLLIAGRFKPALEQADATIDLDPSWVGGRSLREGILKQLGRWEEALEIELDLSLLITGDTIGTRLFHSCVRHYWETGETEPQRCEPPDDLPLSIMYAEMGQKEHYLRALEERMESDKVDYRALARWHTAFGTWGGLDPRDDPRYQELVERVGIDWR